ncbi:MAG TPA: hypothetical protein VE268_05930 [Herpetosiphonaceae bacterium]|nr:hypothetical protein [Herpetosiphonaceae bacterium]
MSEIDDRGEGQPGRRGREGGLSILDLESLPPAQRKIMRLIMRKTEISYTDLSQAFASMPGADHLSQAELDETLDALIQQQFLVRSDGDQAITFRVNHRHNSRSTLRTNIWDALDSGAISNKRRGRTEN